MLFSIYIEWFSDPRRCDLSCSRHLKTRVVLFHLCDFYWVFQHVTKFQKSVLIRTDQEMFVFLMNAPPILLFIRTNPPFLPNNALKFQVTTFRFLVRDLMGKALDRASYFYEYLRFASG